MRRWEVTYKAEYQDHRTVNFYAEHFLQAAQNATQAIWLQHGVSCPNIVKLEQKP